MLWKFWMFALHAAFLADQWILRPNWCVLRVDTSKQIKYCIRVTYKLTSCMATLTNFTTLSGKSNHAPGTHLEVVGKVLVFGPAPHILAGESKRGEGKIRDLVILAQLT